MDFGKIGSLLAGVAPTLATALGGPLAGAAVKALASEFVGDENASAADLEKAISGASPDQLAKLREIDAQFAIRLKELDIDLERINAADRSDARKREIETRDWTPRILAFVILGGYFAALSWLLTHGMPGSGSETLIMMLGSLTSTLTAVVAYYFGSSAGSRAKDSALTKH